MIVCTPQKVAQDDARRALRMFQQLEIEVLGVVENMSYFIGDDAKEYDIFGKGGAQVMAREMGVPFLGAVPINMRLRTNSDQGNPTGNFEDDQQLGRELEAVVKNLAGQISIRDMQGALQQPTISVSYYGKRFIVDTRILNKLLETPLRLTRRPTSMCRL